MLNHLLENKRKTALNGFTLIEVIVVIVIIAILAAIAVPSLTRYINTANQRAMMATAHNIATILQADRVEFYDVEFSNADSGSASPNWPFFGKSYATMLAENGVIVEVAPSEELRYISWDGHKLLGFLYIHKNLAIGYNANESGFSDVVMVNSWEWNDLVSSIKLLG